MLAKLGLIGKVAIGLPEGLPLQSTRAAQNKGEVTMFGIVLVSHNAIGEELLHALHHIVGPQPQARAISIAPEDDMDHARAAVLAAIGEVNVGDGVVLMTDMFGGTPSNLALSVMPKTNAVVLAGVNLPALVKLVTMREAGAAMLEAASEAAASGRKYIQLVTENLAPPVS